MGNEEVSGVWKKYLRELPDALFSDETEDQAIQAKFSASIEDMVEGSEEQIEKIKELIGTLDLTRRSLAKELFYVLYLVSLENEKNLMHSHNLATIFGGMVNIVSSTMTEWPKTTLARIVIENYPRIFGSLDVLTELPETPLEEGAKPIPVRVFLSNGTFKSLFLRPEVRSVQFQKTLRTKLMVQHDVDASNFQLYAFRDREIRLIKDKELVTPIVAQGTCLLFTSVLEPSGLALPLPTGPWNVENEEKEIVVEVSEFTSHSDRTGESTDDTSDDLPSEEVEGEEGDVQDNSPDFVSPRSMYRKSKSSRKSLALGSSQTLHPPLNPEQAAQISEKIIAKEMLYVRQLKLLQEKYIPAMEESGLFNSPKLTEFFAVSKSICEMHSTSRAYMNKKKFLSGFALMDDNFQLYVTFNRLYADAMVQFKALRLDHAAKKILVRCHLSSKQSAPLEWICDGIGSKLLSYPDDFEELQSYLNPESDDYKGIAERLSKIRSANKEIEAAASTSYGYRCKALSATIEKLPSSLTLYSVGRRLIREDAVRVKLPGDRKPRTSRMIIFTDLILIYTVSTRLLSKKERLHYDFHLSIVSDSDAVDHEGVSLIQEKTGLSIKYFDKKKERSLFLTFLDEKETWDLWEREMIMAQGSYNEAKQELVDALEDVVPEEAGALALVALASRHTASQALLNIDPDDIARIKKKVDAKKEQGGEEGEEEEEEEAGEPAEDSIAALGQHKSSSSERRKSAARNRVSGVRLVGVPATPPQPSVTIVPGSDSGSGSKQSGEVENLEEGVKNDGSWKAAPPSPRAVESGTRRRAQSSSHRRNRSKTPDSSANKSISSAKKSRRKSASAPKKSHLKLSRDNREKKERRGRQMPDGAEREDEILKDEEEEEVVEGGHEIGGEKVGSAEINESRDEDQIEEGGEGELMPQEVPKDEGDKAEEKGTEEEEGVEEGTGDFGDVDGDETFPSEPAEIEEEGGGEEDEEEVCDVDEAELDGDEAEEELEDSTKNEDGVAAHEDKEAGDEEVAHAGEGEVDSELGGAGEGEGVGEEAAHEEEGGREEIDA
eukprot:TRINITY_DN3611_c0_g1_i2.p1 TRINITY_DN3611_c0_g1~~TRINITY_DN3611_c0_g1_i2.p1  ORF type:complete len:1150 (-),score=340.22 TRINITY_DN3611_c0_g1_i2:199-3375(-)